MTRPMPGPPECNPQASPHESVPFNGGDFPMCDRHNPKLRYRKSKRLTDAECAAERWRALSSAMFLNWAPLDMLGVEIPADGQLYSVTRPDTTEAEIEADTWQRFATHPHALEGEHA